ncbi:hypothetical protein WN51_07454 [Melipona quadrifasciata]|uniref:Uncharacterized protein n=1 Tax=Melipona quadrifasciata TaxID=166423 RepID=A0A0M9A9B8_9HYME|nr:hypothetical protein WN51_07454 [Melipona quadrifasciata]
MSKSVLHSVKRIFYKNRHSPSSVNASSQKLLSRLRHGVHVGDINIAVSDGSLPFVQGDEIYLMILNMNNVTARGRAIAVAIRPSGIQHTQNHTAQPDGTYPTCAAAMKIETESAENSRIEAANKIGSIRARKKETGREEVEGRGLAVDSAGIKTAGRRRHCGADPSWGFSCPLSHTSPCTLSVQRRVQERVRKCRKKKKLLGGGCEPEEKKTKTKTKTKTTTTTTTTKKKKKKEKETMMVVVEMEEEEVETMILQKVSGLLELRFESYNVGIIPDHCRLSLLRCVIFEAPTFYV